MRRYFGGPRPPAGESGSWAYGGHVPQGPLIKNWFDHPVRALGLNPSRMRASDWLQLICVAYIVVWVISPPLAYGTSYRTLAVSLTGFWLVIELLKRPAGLLRPTAPLLAAGIYTVYSGFWAFYFDGYEGLESNFQIYIFFLFLIFFERYSTRNIDVLRPIFWLSLVLLPIWTIRTLYALETHRNVARLLVRSSDIAREYAKLGVGGYALVYTLAFAAPILLYLLKHRLHLRLARKKGRVGRMPIAILLANLVLGLALILRAGYTIALVISAVGLTIVLIAPNRRSMAAPRLMVMIILGSVIAVFVGSAFLSFLANQSQGTMYEAKMSDLMQTVESEELVGTVGGRVERYWRSIVLALKNPVFGTLTRTDVGKHSAILDRYAQFGVVFGSLFAYAVLYLPMRFMRRSRKNFGLVMAVAFVFTTFSFSNNIFSGLGYMVFIFFPVAYSYLNEDCPAPSSRISN